MSNDVPPPPPPGGGYPPPPGGGAPPPPPGWGAPAPGYGAPGPAPNNYLVWAILTTIFCCLPFGIVSIVYAAQVSGKHAAGDYAGAVQSSENAKKWAIIAAVAGVAVTVIYLVFLIAVAGSA